MCMFGGGGGQPATITKPDYTAYDRQFELQKAAIENQITNQNTTMQNTLHNALSEKQDALSQLAIASQLILHDMVYSNCEDVISYSSR